MQEQDIQQRFHLMQREIEAMVSFVTVAVDSLRLELEIVKMFMQRYYPEFSEFYPKLREEATQAIDFESPGSGTSRKAEE
ncbi:MAG TPA: hypothetical protein VFM35_08495 [Candidatus Binatia bacterium]|nr:hypothetical protein [Candidatus Binatia bacterium]